MHNCFVAEEIILNLKFTKCTQRSKKKKNLEGNILERHCISWVEWFYNIHLDKSWQYHQQCVDLVFAEKLHRWLPKKTNITL